MLLALRENVKQEKTSCSVVITRLRSKSRQVHVPWRTTPERLLFFFFSQLHTLDVHIILSLFYLPAPFCCLPSFLASFFSPASSLCNECLRSHFMFILFLFYFILFLFLFFSRSLSLSLLYVTSLSFSLCVCVSLSLSPPSLHRPPVTLSLALCLTPPRLLVPDPQLPV